MPKGQRRKPLTVADLGFVELFKPSLTELERHVVEVEVGRGAGFPPRSAHEIAALTDLSASNVNGILRNAKLRVEGKKKSKSLTADEKKFIVDWLPHLTPTEREVVFVRYLANPHRLVPLKQVARTLDLSFDSVNLMLRRARKRINGELPRATGQTRRWKPLTSEEVDFVKAWLPHFSEYEAECVRLTHRLDWIEAGLDLPGRRSPAAVGKQLGRTDTSVKNALERARQRVVGKRPALNTQDPQSPSI